MKWNISQHPSQMRRQTLNPPNQRTGKPFRKVLRQARGGRHRLKRGGSEEKITGSISLTVYLSYKASDSYIPSYSLLVTVKPPTPTTVKKLAPTNVLLDTGASISLLPLWQAKQLGVEVKRKDGIRVCGADGKLLAITGVGYIYARDQDCTFWKGSQWWLPWKVIISWYR